MKVFLLKDIERIGVSGEIVKVSDGYGLNYLIPNKLAVEINEKNEEFFKKRVKVIEHRQEVISSKTSMLAEKIKALKLTIKRKMHDDGKLYGSVNPAEIVDLLSEKGVSVAKNQIEFGKSIKEKGTYDITVKLSSKLQPKVALTILPE